MWRESLCTIALLSIATTGCYRSYASDPRAVRGETDPPGRVARLSYLKGEVSFLPAGGDEWTAADLNRPVTTGDQLWTEAESRAELQLGTAAIRMGSKTSLEVLALDDEIVQLKVTEGVVGIRIRSLYEREEFEIDTPGGAVTLLRVGDYRVDVPVTGGPTRVTARSGRAEVTDPAGGTTTVGVTSGGPFDAFDEFCRDRDRREDGVLTRRYVSPGVIGYEDLDEWGIWADVAPYGWVWRPRVVAAGWRPYGFGHWVWIEPWGWTWIDDAPWGFAPFHYGRWVFVNGVWLWIPGPIGMRPWYSPALVVFIGGGAPGFRYHYWFGGGAGVAWFPLGPREIYRPPYRVSHGYLRNINISNTVVANEERIHRIDAGRQNYVNRGLDGAVTAMSRDAFARGERVSRTGGVIPGSEARAAQISGTAPPVAPTRASLSGMPERVGRVPRPSPDLDRRNVTVRRTPPAAPVPFERRQPTLERMPGKPEGAVTPVPRARPPAVTLPQTRPEPQVRPPATPVPQARPEPKPAPQLRRQPQPQVQPPTRTERRLEDRSRRQEETRRQGIERERRQEQRQPQRPPQRQGGERRKPGPDE